MRLGYNNGSLLFALRGSLRMAKNYRNPVDGRVYLTNFTEKNLSALLGIKNEKGSTNINVTLYDNHQSIPDGSRDSLSRKFTRQIYEAGEDIIEARPIVPNTDLNSYRIPALSQHIQHYRAYVHSFFKAGNGDIDILAALQQNIRREYNHPTMPEQSGMHARLNTFNYGLKYNTKKFAGVEATIGINGMVQNNKSLAVTDFPIPDYNLHENGMYVYGKWKRDKWTISGGLRYDMRQVNWNDFYVKQNPVTAFDEHIKWPDTTSATLQFEGYKKLFYGTSASIGATFKINEQFSVKANIGRAYRAPNITEMASNGLDPGAHIVYLGNKHFNPEFSLQEDIGIILRTKNVSAEVSLFNNHIQNYIYLHLVADEGGNPVTDVQGNRTYQYQQSVAQLYGAEAWVSLHPSSIEGLRLDNSLSMVYGFNKNPIYKNKKTAGEYLPLIPPAKILSSISQKIHLQSKEIKSIRPAVEMEINAAQNRFLALNQTETASPGYILINIGIINEIQLSKTQTLQFQFELSNVFNKAYQSHLSRLKYFEYYSQSPNGRAGIYNMGRNCSIKMILPF